MSAVSVRRGTTLAELVVALALAGVVMGAASGTVVQYLRQRSQREADDRARDAVRTTRDVLRAELAHADADVRVLGDTALQLSALRVVATACDASANRLVLPAGVPMWSAPRTGDSLAIADTSQGGDWRTTVLSVRAERASAECPTGGTRVVLAASPPVSVLARLLPTRIWRVVRYVLYRGGDGSWWLGERGCAPGCSAAQPIAGPLRSPSQGGLRLALVLGPGGQPRALDVSVRAVAGNRGAALSVRLPLGPVR